MLYHNHSFDNLVFDAEELAFAEDCGNAANPKGTLLHESSEVQDAKAAAPHRRVSSLSSLKDKLVGLRGGFDIRRLATWTSAIFVFCAAALAIVSYICLSDGYHVETKLLFFDRDPNSGDAAENALKKEVQIFKSSQISHLLACELYDREPACLSGQCFLQTATDARPTRLSRFGSRAGLEKWLNREICISSQISGSTAKVRLGLRGDDPEFLRSVLDAYVCRYADYRRNLEAEACERLQQTQHQKQQAAESNLAATISSRLQKIALQERGCHLALQLIDSGKGAFSGFVSDPSLTGLPSLVPFQEKIVQLEIKKRSLATQFMPHSKELAAVDLEIQGMRSAMRECLVEHLHFLKKEKEQFLRHGKSLEHKAGSVAAHDRAPGKEPCGGASSPQDRWLAPRDGLYVLREVPLVAKRPLLVRTGHFADHLLAYFAPSPAKTEMSLVKREGDSSRQAEPNVEGKVCNSTDGLKGSPTHRPLPCAATTPRVWRRAATYGNAPRTFTGSTKSGPRR